MQKALKNFGKTKEKSKIKNKLTNPPFARADFYAAEIFARNDIMLSQGFVIL